MHSALPPKKLSLFSVKHYMSYLNSTGDAGLVFTESCGFVQGQRVS